MESKAASTDNFQVVFLAIATLFLLSLLYSTFLLSVSMFCIGFVAVVDVQWPPLRLRLRPQFFDRLGRITREPVWWVTGLSFALVLYGGMYSDDTTFWLSRLRIKAPFLLLPMAFFLMPRIRRDTYDRLHAILLLIAALSTLPILFDLFSSSGQINQLLQQGKAIDTPIRHVRYSLLIALASMAGFISWYGGKHVLVSRRLVVGLAIYLFLFLHLLAVRSGLACFYLTAMVLLCGSLSGPRRQVVAIALAVLVLAPIPAYLTIPTLRNRVDYMMEDYRKYRLREWNAYSDAERLLSLQAGLDIARDHWRFGVGPGDVRTKMDDYFKTEFDKYWSLLPHNQFVLTMVGSGLIGLLLFGLAFLLPILAHGHWREPYFLALHLIIFFSMLVESTLETSVGVALYLFFLLAGLTHLRAGPMPRQA